MLPPTYKTERYILQPYRREDEERFVEMALDKESVRFIGGANGVEAEERELFNKIFDLYKKQEKRWFWIWGVYKDDQLCAHLELKNETTNTKENELEIVYLVHPQERKKGLMTEILELLKEKQHLWKKTIIATINPKNTNSFKLLKKWGIVKKETIKKKEKDGEYLKITLK